MAFLGHLGPLQSMGRNHGPRPVRRGLCPWTLKPPEATGTAHLNLSQHLKGNSSTPPCTPYSRLQKWCIYGIIYHYAPFLLSNSIVTFLVPNSIFPNQGPKSNAHFEGGFLNLSVWQSMAAIRRPLKDLNHLALQELGCQFHSGLFQGHSHSLYIISISFQGINYFNTPWATQLVHTGINQSTCMYLAQLGQFIFHCGNPVTQFKIQDGQICIDPIQTIQLVTHLPGSVLQLFTYTGHLSAPGDFVPS
ncbi:hypothetical protein O181_027160 [Austropuccinia psidii MF-1]|uniref:Uncharacterized protein n=1 Tax=Austropuccinia psidii MF-1 TaxID=1389203 RepID=A0A9Q3CQU1_9BASI|nr:hypothetical protein [Austropuccinia psidii MF-1]